MDSLCLRVPHPPPNLAQKTHMLHKCMQKSQLAVVVIVAKPSQNLHLNDINCNRSKPRLTLYLQPGQWALKKTLATPPKHGGSLWLVSTEHNYPGLCFPDANIRYYCDRIKVGCLQEQASSIPLTESM